MKKAKTKEILQALEFYEKRKKEIFKTKKHSNRIFGRSPFPWRSSLKEACQMFKVGPTQLTEAIRLKKHNKNYFYKFKSGTMSITTAAAKELRLRKENPDLSIKSLPCPICGRKHFARGLCRRCYDRRQRMIRKGQKVHIDEYIEQRMALDISRKMRLENGLTY